MIRDARTARSKALAGAGLQALILSRMGSKAAVGELPYVLAQPLSRVGFNLLDRRHLHSLKGRYVFMDACMHGSNSLIQS